MTTAMDSTDFFLYLAVMAGVTYAVRAVPFVLCRGEIENVFVRSFLTYVPYAVLGAMTFPAIFSSTGNVASALAGTVVAFVLAFWGRGLLTVAVCACVAALAVAMMLSGCTLSTPEDITLDEWEMGGEYQSLRSARIDDTILYGYGEYGVYLKKGKTAVPQKIEEISDQFDISKISATDRYFYLSGNEISDAWGGKSNVLVVDTNGKVIGSKNCCCDWVYVRGDTVFGYYTGQDELDPAIGWAARRIEATHCMEEKNFLKDQGDDISKWKGIAGDRVTIEGKTFFRQKDADHDVPYYTDTVYCDAHDVLEGLLYVDGSVSSNTDREAAKPYIEQLQEMMGEKEKNFDVSAWQSGDKLFGVCCVYRQSGGFLQHFTKDIERSLWFEYNPDQDAISLEETYPGKEVVYWDEDWVIYRKKSAVYIENLKKKKTKKVFESDAGVTVDLSDDIAVMWGTKDGELQRSDAIILE